MFGLSDRDIHLINKAIGKFAEIEKAYVFGSRSMGNYKKGSDIDIAISGKTIANRTLFELDSLLNEELPLPYFFDILHYEKITNYKLRDHIDTHGTALNIHEKTMQE